MVAAVKAQRAGKVQAGTSRASACSLAERAVGGGS